MDFIDFVKNNNNTPMPSSFKSIFKGGENVKVQRNSSLDHVIFQARKEMSMKLGQVTE
jgi:hypothetical protein